MVDVLTGTQTVKIGHAQMLKGGVIMDVVSPEQARIAEEAGAVAVMALERVPADIRADGGVARMTDPGIITKIMDAVSIPVMAKCRIGHFVEAQVLQALGVDYIDESEVLTPADEVHHVWKHDFTVPFVCGCRDLGEALRRISEGATMIRTKGEAGTGDVVEAVRHMRAVQDAIRKLQNMPDDELVVEARNLGVSLELLTQTREEGRLPVVNFAAGGVATPADAALMMQLGADGVFVGSGIFKSGDPASRGYAIVQSVTHYNDPKRGLQRLGRANGWHRRPHHPGREPAGTPEHLRKSPLTEYGVGVFEVTVGLGRLGDGELTPVTAMVDTGAAHSVMPDSLLRQLGVAPIEYRPFTIADGNEVEYGFGMARLSIEGREFPCPVLFGAEGQFLLGATSLQIFHLMVDSVEEKLVTKPLRARAI